MRVSVESTGTLERKMTVAVPAEQVEQAIATRLTDLSKTAKLPGFRPGKVPMKMMESKFGGEVRSEIVGDLIQRSLFDALDKEGLVPAGQPSLQPSKLEKGQDLEYIATFEIFPDIESTAITGKSIEKPVVEVADEDIDRTLERMQKQQVSWEPGSEPAADADRITINFKGTVDGEVFQGGEADDFPLVLGENMVLPDLEKALIGTKNDQELNVEVNFPEDYANKDMAGKLAVFAVKVVKVENPKYPEIDSKFAETLGMEGGDVDKLRQEVKASLERELEGRIDVHMREQALRVLLESNNIEVPKRLVEGEINNMINTNKEQLKSQGLPTEAAEIDRSAYEEEATRRVKMGLVLREVIEKNSLKADPERVQKKLEELASGYEDPNALIQWYYEDKSRLAQVQSVVLEQQVVELLLQDVDSKDKKMGFQEFMNPTKVADK